MQDLMLNDTVTVENFDSEGKSLLIRAHGQDRPGVIAEVTGALEINKLYVASITFNLVRPTHNQYQMEILAKGALTDLEHVNDLIDTGEFWEPAISKADYIYWPAAYMFHVALNTPDSEGLIAKISQIVGKPRETESAIKVGSFIHMLGITYNSGGAQGGTPYFYMRANIATQSLEIQEQIERHLRTWAKKNHIEDDLWIRNLNH